MEDLTDDERAEMADADQIERMPAHPAETPAPPVSPDHVTPSVPEAELDASASVANAGADDEEPNGLEESDPFGLEEMAEALDELDETPDSGPTTYAEVKRRKKRRTAKVPLVLDTSVRWDLVNAKSEAEEAGRWVLASPDDPERQARLDAALAEVEKHEGRLEAVTVVWQVQSISRQRVRSLVSACPPSPEQMSRHKMSKAALGQASNEPLYDPDLFQPALVSACAVEPALAIEDAVEMWQSEEWTEGELDSLFQTAWLLNQYSI